jgi:arylsulfatase A-like enzyme
MEDRGVLSRPNLLVVITDQQRYPRYWPDDPGFLAELMPNDAELARTGLTFRHGFCNTAMCSPSRATLLTGRYPAEHGVTLTLTAADLKPDPRNTPAVVATLAGILQRSEAPPRRVLKQFARGALRLGPKAGNEPTLPPAMPNLATMLRDAGYTVAYKGKWHLTHPGGGPDALLAGWTRRDSETIAALGFNDWDPPDAGENTKADNFGGGAAGHGDGWDAVYASQAEQWLTRADLPEPFCLIISLVNPHDVLGYPASYRQGGYSDGEFRDLGIELPPTVDEDLSDKPAVHSLMRLGMAAYLGPLRDRRAKLDYVNFYAHLHRVVDRHIGRIVGALGSAEDPESLRSRTVVVRCADHGEMGLSHGGLRQKAFNVYEETINIPLVVSNPVMFPEPATTDALASLVDLAPTLLSLAGEEPAAELRGRDLTPVFASPQSATVQDAVHYTFDDHHAATASQNAPGQPNRIRGVRTSTAKYAVYYDPSSRMRSEYELYNLNDDPLEVENLVDPRSGVARSKAARSLQGEMSERLQRAMAECRTTPVTARPPAWTPPANGRRS